METVYTSSDGTEKDIQAMPTRYLKNAINKLKRRSEYHTDKDREVLGALTCEMNSRNLRKDMMDTGEFWITADKELLKINELQDSHLLNIIIHITGLQNIHITKETLDTWESGYYKIGKEYWRMKMELIKRSLI